MFCDKMEKKPAVLCEELGIERDEDVGVSLEDLPPVDDPSKPQLKRKALPPSFAAASSSLKKIRAV